MDHLVICADFDRAYNKRSAAINMSNKTRSTVETEKTFFKKCVNVDILEISVYTQNKNVEFKKL